MTAEQHWPRTRSCRSTSRSPPREIQRGDRQERELANHYTAEEHAREIEEFLRDKYTNQRAVRLDGRADLRDVLPGLPARLRRGQAGRARVPLRAGPARTSNFVQFGYWDSLRKGLLAGERLYHDLKRMEVAYLDQNRREYELTKHVSLALLHPEALVELRETGRCFVELPEALFDLDCPGHYMRRIKAVSLTIPCVTGPYTSVSCTLTLLGNRIRREHATVAGVPTGRDLDDPPLRRTTPAASSRS